MPEGGWTSVSLADAVEPVVVSRRRDELPPDEWFVAPGDFDARGDLLRVRRVAHARARTLMPFAAGDVLVNPTPAQAKVWLADRSGFCPASITVLRPTGRLDPRYLLWGLRALSAAGTTLRLKELARHRIRVPVDSAYAASTVALFQTLAAAIDARSQALDLTGRLATAIFDQRFGDPLATRGRWQTATLGELLEQIETGWSPRCADRPAARGEWGVIKLSAVSTGSFLPGENKALPPETPPRAELALHDGDLLMVRSNTKALVGTTALVKGDHPNLLLADKVWRLRPRSDVHPVFLKGLLSHPVARRRLAELATGSVASMQNLTQARLHELQVIRPPLSRQSDFAAQLNSVEQARTAQQRQLADLDALTRQLLDVRFPAVEPGEQRPASVVFGRALHPRLSPLQQATWAVLVQADLPYGMPELNRRLVLHGHTPQVDELRHALNVLMAAGAAVRSGSGPSHEWVEARPVPIPDPA